MLAMARSADFAAGVELVIFALESQQLVVGAAFDNVAVLEDDDAVAVAHGRKAVGNHEGRAPFHQGIHAALHEGLGAGVNAAGCWLRVVHVECCRAPCL